MGGALEEVLPLAVVVAASPVPILAILLILLSDRELPNAFAFLAGWSLSLAAMLSVVWALGIGRSADGEPSTTFAVVELVIAALLVGYAVHEWRSRPRKGEEREPARWMHAVRTVRPIGALALGVALVVLNPKAVALTLTAGSRLGGADLEGGGTVAAVAAYTLVGSASILLLILVAVVSGEQGAERLHRARGWMERHGPVALGAISLLVGAILATSALRTLA